MTVDEIGYALSKQVPDMAHGVILQTAYGELMLDGRDAERVAALVRKLLQARLRAAERHDATG
jgi:uncharacterized membrane protein affecting hemolysin expression